jgi:predicted small lipoprotein YifL
LGCALGAAVAIVLSGCGQKGPLFLPATGGPSARPAASAPSAPEDNRPAAPIAPLPGASSPGLPPAAR